MNYGHKDHEHHQRIIVDHVKLGAAPSAPDRDKNGISVTIRGDMQAFIDASMSAR
jgi:hypothetical protein